MTTRAADPPIAQSRDNNTTSTCSAMSSSENLPYSRFLEATQRTYLTSLPDYQGGIQAFLYADDGYNLESWRVSS